MLERHVPLAGPRPRDEAIRRLRPLRFRPRDGAVRQRRSLCLVAPPVTIGPDHAELAGAFPDTQFYGMSVALYEDTYLGGLWVYRPSSDGAIDTQLAASHDGVRWERVGGRAALLSLDKLGRPLDGMIRNSPSWITV